jgi:hypothetical protein
MDSFTFSSDKCLATAWKQGGFHWFLLNVRYHGALVVDAANSTMKSFSQLLFGYESETNCIAIRFAGAKTH